jgi:cytochrome b subunit of formate dehydrogenase
VVVRAIILWIAVAGLAPAQAGAAPAQGAPACLECHSDKDLATERAGKVLSLHVDPAVFGKSVHRELECGACHAGLDPGEVPHAATIKPANCLDCHDNVAATHRFHASLAQVGISNGGPGRSCAGCHGTHDIAPPGAPGSKFHPAWLVESCGACHAAVVEQFRGSAHGRALAADQPGAPTCLTCHTEPLTVARAAGETTGQKIAQERMCLSCHLDNPEIRRRMGPATGFIGAYERSVHGKALLRGNARAANCVDCHGSHAMKEGLDATAGTSHQNLPGTCGTCHEGEAAEYGRSVHAAALFRGAADAPVCTDCHGEHAILGRSDPGSRTAPGNIAAQVCAPCHASLRLTEKYELGLDRTVTYDDSFHGLAIREGVAGVANCASCHGAHAILPSSDPASTIHRSHLAETCGRCHPGAGDRFAGGTVHVALADPGEPVLYWIGTGYVALIVLVVGGMLLHNLLDFLRKARRRLAIRRSGGPAHANGNGLHLRMTLSERLQHGALLTSFMVLVVTGFMLHYPEAWWVQGLRRISRWLFDQRALIHRVAGVVMVLVSIYHLGYLVLTARGRALARDLMPRRQDLYDVIGMLRYNLGLAADRPRFGRFGYVEKSEYWALVWGTILMGATGIILWFEGTFIGLLTKLGWDVARTVHFYEAWLATLAILVWHIYFVIFNPDVYPMNLAWLRGTLSEEEMEDEHPLELEAIRRQRVEASKRASKGDAGVTPRPGS